MTLNRPQRLRKWTKARTPPPLLPQQQLLRPKSLLSTVVLRLGAGAGYSDPRTYTTESLLKTLISMT